LTMFPVDYGAVSVVIESALLRMLNVCLLSIVRWAKLLLRTVYVFECQRARSCISDTSRNPSSEHGCSLLAARAHVCGKWKRRHKAIHPINLPSCRDFLLHLCTGNPESSDESNVPTRCSHNVRTSSQVSLKCIIVYVV
jgi:hypothetical protein